MKHLKLLLFCFLYPFQTHAFNWQDLWVTPNQQAQDCMNKKQYEQAKKLFERTDWQAAAAYKAADYQLAKQLFKGFNTEQGYYNHGNALAQLGQYEQAIKAYDQALTLNPKNEDARYNRQLISELLKKKKDQQSKSQKHKDQQGKEQEGKEQQNKDQQNREQQNKERSNKRQKRKIQNEQNPQKEPAQAQKDHKEMPSKSNKVEQEKQLAKEQWLKLIPDDPGGLMREKFLRDHLKRKQEMRFQ